MAEKLAEQNTKDGGETSNNLVPEGYISATVDKEQAASVGGEVTLLATLVSRLAEQFNENRSDTANEITELRSLIESKFSQPQVTPSSTVSHSAATFHMPHFQHTPSDSSLIPPLADLRADSHLVGQAEKLVENIQANIEGKDINIGSNYNKRGWVRAGGETAPSLRMPWPLDYIFDFGRNSKIYYEDLNCFEWVFSYAAIVEAQTNPSIARHMLVHLQNLMGDAQSHGFEVVKYAHGVILSRLEMGKLTWPEVHEMSESRRTAITRGISQ
jgi:hypothetical protein